MEEKRAINRLMNKAASSSIGDVELVIFVVEGTRWTPDDEMVLNKLRDGKAPVILAVNKVDNVQEKGSAAAPAVPRQPDELPRYRADFCGNRAERRYHRRYRA
jgi:small GTP-binding protein